MTDSHNASAERYCPSCERSYHEGRLCPKDGTELVSLGNAPDPLIGRSLNDRYTIQERLGAGGMGTVYRSMQHSVGREVAIKVVSPGLVTDPAAIKRFLREAKLASRLSHPNAVSMLDFGQTADGLFFLVMELLVGQTLDKVIRTGGRLALPRVARIADQICDALDGAHRLEIIHRDLKPANVMLLDGAAGRDLVKVLDFGLAKSLSKDTASTTMTGSGALLGTPAYMSPEAALGRELDARCDLYSLGCMLYVLASGRLPFHSDSVHELVSMQANMPPPPITGVPAPVAEVIMRLLAKQPADRFGSAAETRRVFDEAMASSRASNPMAIDMTLPHGAREALPVGALADTIDSSPVHAVAEARAAPVASPPGVAIRPRSPLIAIAALGVIAIAGTTVWIARGSRDDHETASEPGAPTSPEPAPTGNGSAGSPAPIATGSAAGSPAPIATGSAAGSASPIAEGSATDSSSKPSAPGKRPRISSPKVTDSKTTGPRPNDAKPIDPKTTDPKTTDPKTTDPKTTDPKTTDPKTTDPNPDPKTPDPKNPDPKNPDPKNPDPKTPDPKPIDPKTIDKPSDPKPKTPW